jgi:ATP-dependent Clp protease protease subunit
MKKNNNQNRQGTLEEKKGANNMLTFKNAITEVNVYGSIYPDTAKKFKDFITSIDDSADIVININSNGGDVFAGIAMYNTIKNHKGKTTINIDGLAASIASVIAMAGDEIIMPKNSLMMIHNAWTFAFGNASDFRKLADDMDKIGNSIIETYMSRTTESREAIQKLLDKETWLSADEALKLNLCTEVTGEKENKKDDKVLEEAKAMFNKKDIVIDEPELEPTPEPEPEPKANEEDSFMARFLKNIK